MENLVNVLEISFTDDGLAQTDRLDIVSGHHDRHLVIEDLEDVEFLLLPSHILLVDFLDDGHPVKGINRVVANFKHHSKTSFPEEAVLET